MAHTGIFATQDEILFAAGTALSTAITEARINAACLQAESYINDVTDVNWSDIFAASMNIDKKYILSEAEACLVAIHIIGNQMSAYSSLEMASTMMDKNAWRFNSCIKILIDAKDKIKVNP